MQKEAEIGMAEQWAPKQYESNDRMGFIRKVYGILTVQLSITSLLTGITVGSSGFRSWLTTNIYFLLVCIILSFSTLIALFCFHKYSRVYPRNYILLFIFTFAESFLVANVAAFYDPTSVLIAAIMTLGVTIGVTAYAFYTKTDYTVLRGSMFGLFIGAVLFAIFLAVFYQGRLVVVIISFIFVIIYTFYIVYDTQLIAGRGRFALGYDEYIIGALVLYLDIINLFLCLLRLFGGKR